MLKIGQKQREACKEGMKQRIKEQIRTKLATEIVNLADTVLIRESWADGRNAARKDFDTYRKGRGGKRGMILC